MRLIFSTQDDLDSQAHLSKSDMAFIYKIRLKKQIFLQWITDLRA